MKKLWMIALAACCVLALAACTVKKPQESGDVSQLPNPVHESTAEEVAVFRFATEEEAQACRELLAQRLESRKTDFANYMPDEAARLENGVLMCSGCCVALCVSSGDTAREIISGYLG